MLKQKLSLNAIILILLIIAGIETAGLFCSQTPPVQRNDKKETQQKNNSARPLIFMFFIDNTDRGVRCIVDWLETNNEAVMALATIAIALFTFTLWQTSEEHSRHMEESIAIANKSADAAKKSADSFQSIERARLFLKVERDPPPKPGQYIEGVKEGYNQVKISIVNEGKSLAVLTKINWHVGVMNDKEIDDKISELTSRKTEFPNGVIIIRREGTKKIPAGYDITKIDLQKINEETAFYVCLGHIKYKDVFRRVRPIVFCWKDDGVFFVPDPERNSGA